MKKNIAFTISLFLLLILTNIGYADNAQDKIGWSELMGHIDDIRDDPMGINEDLCGNDQDKYKIDMNNLANDILLANKTIQQYNFYCPINLWAIYNAFTANPICGSGDAALSLADSAHDQVIRCEESLEIIDNAELCNCFDFPTGTWKRTGILKNGACRCYNY